MPQRQNSPTNRQALVERVAAVIRDNSLVMKDDKILVAVSGGPDSVALLHLLREIDIPVQLLAAYIDHGLRPSEIPHEVHTLQDICRTLDIPFFTRSVDVHRLLATEKRSPEEAARILRYQSLEELCREHRCQLIATGHNADDQVEEFLLRLVRGSSRRGLSGMALKRGKVIRPLLHETKKSLTEYLTEKNVKWCLDSSNLQRHFLRNRVRLELLPLLEREFNPAIRRTILQNMDILAGEEEYLAGKTEEAVRLCVQSIDTPEGGMPRQLFVSTEQFLDQHRAIRRRILEQCFLRMGIRPAYGQLDTVDELSLKGAVGAEIHLDDGVRVENRTGCLLFSRPLEKGKKRGSKAALPAIELTVEGPGTYPVPEHGRELVIEQLDATRAMQDKGEKLLVDRSKISFPLRLRSVRPGETFHPYNGPGRKKVSRYFNDRKIPAHERKAWPVLLQGDDIIALPGLQIDHAFRVTESTSEAMVIDWRRIES